MRALNESGGRGTAICWGESPSGIDIRLAALTPFGGVLREWKGCSKEFLQSLIDDTIEAGAGRVHIAGPVADFASATEGFSQRRADVPSTGIGSERVAFWWSRVPKGDIEFKVGDRLGVRVRPVATGHDVEYCSQDGRFAGLHGRLRAAPDAFQRGVVGRARAVVERAAFGMDFDRHGQEVVTQLLMLRIPHELATAFPDATLPRLRDMENG